MRNDKQVVSRQSLITMLLIMISPLASAATLAPVSMIEVAQHGLPIQIETTTADVELDVPILTPDGNILHLLGTAHPRTLDNAAFAEISADLVGVTLPDCTAHVEVLIDASTRRSLAQKLKMTCMGHTIRDAFVNNSPLPPRQSASWARGPCASGAGGGEGQSLPRTGSGGEGVAQ